MFKVQSFKLKSFKLCDAIAAMSRYVHKFHRRKKKTAVQLFRLLTPQLFKPEIPKNKESLIFTNLKP